MTAIARPEYDKLIEELSCAFREEFVTGHEVTGLDLRTILEMNGFCLVRREPTKEDLDACFKAEPIPSMRASKEHYMAALKKYVERYE